MEKKIAIRLFIVLIVMVLGIVIGYICWGMSTLSSTTEIDLTKLTIEEKSKLIEYNYLELANYPKSLEFIKLKEESEVRETQYIITFSVDNVEKDLYKIEKDKIGIAGESSIFKIEEKDNKTIYEFRTNFTSNTKGYKWNFISDLIRKYENTNSSTTKMNEKEKLKKELVDYLVVYDIFQKEELNEEELKIYNKTRYKINSLIERLEKNQSSIQIVMEEFKELKEIAVEKTYNPAKEELQKQLNNYIVTYNIMQKGAKDFEEIQKYIDKENKLKALQERLEQTENQNEIENIKSEFEGIIDF
ncbi:MAG: hypothetical protein J5881_01140 [Clostridia bacterium]|nr:hypothetical protein [Clostridia bacterium]